MQILFEVLIVVLPAIIAGLSTFLITKYTYNKNTPLDKLEKSYNRVYYPLYRLISNKNINNDVDLILERTRFYLEKYDKYVDRSTQKAFNALFRCDTKAKKRVAYQNFKNNIYNKNAYLRRRLGYLEPNFWQLYTYSSDSEKSFLRIVIEFCFVYLLLVLDIFMVEILGGISNIGGIYVIPILILGIGVCVLVLEVVWAFIRLLYYKIRK